MLPYMFLIALVLSPVAIEAVDPQSCASSDRMDCSTEHAVVVPVDLMQNKVSLEKRLTTNEATSARSQDDNRESHAQLATDRLSHASGAGSGVGSTGACQGDSNTWNAGYGKCPTYSGYNRNWCSSDQSGGLRAYQVCSECGSCTAAPPPPPPPPPPSGSEVELQCFPGDNSWWNGYAWIKPARGSCEENIAVLHTITSAVLSCSNWYGILHVDDAVQLGNDLGLTFTQQTSQGGFTLGSITGSSALPECQKTIGQLNNLLWDAEAAATAVDECGVAGGAGIPTGDCDCSGNQNDECGVCGGAGIPTGDCDCSGNQNDACGVCGGAGIPTGDCDCSGNQNDECGVCDGAGIPTGDCDCSGNQNDECGVCDGVGIPTGDCDCSGNQNDECGVCGGAGIPAGSCDCSGNPCEVATPAPALVQCLTDDQVGPVDTTGCSYQNELLFAEVNGATGSTCLQTGNGCDWQNTRGCGCWVCTSDLKWMMKVIDAQGKDLSNGSERTAKASIDYLNSNVGISGNPFEVGGHSRHWSSLKLNSCTANIDQFNIWLNNNQASTARPSPPTGTTVFTGYGPGSDNQVGGQNRAAAQEFCEGLGGSLATLKEAILDEDSFNAQRNGHCCFWLDEEVKMPIANGLNDPRFSFTEWSEYATSLGKTLTPDTRQNPQAVEDNSGSDWNSDMCLSAEDFARHPRWRKCGHSRNTMCVTSTTHNWDSVSDTWIAK